jgi:hypothetical protein
LVSVFDSESMIRSDPSMEGWMRRLYARKEYVAIQVMLVWKRVGCAWMDGLMKEMGITKGKEVRTVELVSVHGVLVRVESFSLN